MMNAYDKMSERNVPPNLLSIQREEDTSSCVLDKWRAAEDIKRVGVRSTVRSNTSGGKTTNSSYSEGAGPQERGVIGY